MIPEYLIGDDLTIRTTLLGKTRVTYKLPLKKDYIPGQYSVRGISADGKAFLGSYISGDDAESIRSGFASDIVITLG